MLLTFTLPPAYAGVVVSGIDASAASDAATTIVKDRILKFILFWYRTPSLLMNILDHSI